MKKEICILFFALMMFSCNNDKSIKSQIELAKEQVKDAVKDNHDINSQIDSSIVNIDSIIDKDRVFKLICLDNKYWKDKEKQECNFLIIENNRDTIFKSDEFTNCFEVKDFNEDGYRDVLINYFTNIPNINDLLLYNPKKHNFEKIINFQDFPSSSKLKNAKYYYSYHRSGCADMNWDSDLFYIDGNNECIVIGNISGRGCEAKDKTGIYINKVVADQEVLLEFIKREEGYYEDKWEFIESYWTKNYKKFIK